MQLVVQSGAEPGRNYDLTAQKVVIGRQSGNDVVVPDEQVSRKHAEVEERDGRLIVTDLNSSNGTFVNGTRIGSPQVLQAGDTVQVGTTVLKVMASEGGAATLPTSTNYRQAAQDAGYGAGAAAAPDSYAAQSGYGSTPQPSVPDYGQSPSAYGQQNQAYDANQGYGAPPNNYGQVGGYGQAAQPYDPNQGQSYNQPGVYNQPPPQGQAYDPNQAQGYNPQAAYAPQGGYGGQQVGAVATPKKGLPLALLAIIGVVVVLAIVLLVVFVVLGGGGGSGAVGDLPAPKNSTKLDFSTQDLATLSSQSVPSNEIGKYSVGLYKSTDKPDAIKTFYTDEMKKKGWTVSSNSTASNLEFTKGDLRALAGATAIPDQATLTALETAIPKIKDKFKVGDTLVILAQGPKGTTN